MCTWTQTAPFTPGINVSPGLFILFLLISSRLDTGCVSLPFTASKQQRMYEFICMYSRQVRSDHRCSLEIHSSGFVWVAYHAVTLLIWSQRTPVNAGCERDCRYKCVQKHRYEYRYGHTHTLFVLPIGPWNSVSEMCGALCLLDFILLLSRADSFLSSHT